MTPTGRPASAPPIEHPGANRILSIQYLRAIAALVVVAYHSGHRVSDHLPESAAQIINLGHAGVDLFFVISGFIMWSIGRDSTLSPAQFLLRRAIRVAPPYWIATLSWVALMGASGANWISLDLWHVAGSLAFVPHWSPTFPGKLWPVLVPGWTLTFEMFFYAIFALALVVATRWRLGVLLGILFALVIAGLALPADVAIFAAYTSPLLLEFIAGVLIAEAMRHLRPPPVLGVLPLLLAVAVLTGFGALVIPDQTSWLRPVVFGSASVLVVLGALFLEPILPRWPLLERLGDASYAIYLFHIMVIFCLAQTVFRLDAFRIDTVPDAAAFIALSLCLSAAAGLAFHKRIEAPLQRGLRAALTAKRAKTVPE